MRLCVVWFPIGLVRSTINMCFGPTHIDYALSDTPNLSADGSNSSGGVGGGGGSGPSYTARLNGW